MAEVARAEGVDNRLMVLQSILRKAAALDGDKVTEFANELKTQPKGEKLVKIFDNMDREEQKLVAAFNKVDELQLSLLIKFMGEKMAGSSDGFNFTVEGYTLEELADVLQNFFLLTGKNMEQITNN
jgi:hypothetical protein